MGIVLRIPRASTRLVLSIAETSKIVNLKHAAKPQELANWDAIAIAQSCAKQKHTALKIQFSVWYSGSEGPPLDPLGFVFLNRG